MWRIWRAYEERPRAFAPLSAKQCSKLEWNCGRWERRRLKWTKQKQKNGFCCFFVWKLLCAFCSCNSYVCLTSCDGHHENRWLTYHVVAVCGITARAQTPRTLCDCIRAVRTVCRAFVPRAWSHAILELPVWFRFFFCVRKWFEAPSDVVIVQVYVTTSRIAIHTVEWRIRCLCVCVRLHRVEWSSSWTKQAT